ncbi:iron-sulfur flavoprotein, putative [Entamoeba histolytica HM-1:IMSS-B]|uniref:Iron-sulfur flavoprotein, putative n=6 Tax=Entamoeba histolytica TaxID=5759 RepID=C4MAX9_ENTH1|nr:iron-sulfur flavoprotein, putative [Entamoeba histolytica HM-1:IMSS]EMD45863.1 ironsulfur flavoprotein, putative [Entamoeba histolytica KU27]EMH73611.1 iron-sulfur flavoprotein, putative [Entamoeba histolytica HM-1:IMSS-B]EMS16263.1 iron-sulfur flavoprotein, putative [Entamoeba histolytica HM-3:IMSS]ENY64320.1 iron-sulfur flavoprotein, putative [Entamoeba histolytica HM-1:IMSS-A]GAT99024.1 iron-sulfur flavoprotein putative [Entamoeba histolytica]|eukprot:XP_649371.1 iron-sulfur flavoprotein, putative [Entamoeba histolytica HM-1:IMSS]
MSLKVLTLLASAIEKGNTGIMLENFLKGLTSKKQIENHIVNVCKEQLNGCAGCLACKNHKEVYCSQNDRCSELMKEFIEADLVIFAFPIYWYAMPGQLKVFIDRTVMMMDWNTFSAKQEVLDKGKKTIVALTTCGSAGYDRGVFEIKEIASLFGYSFNEMHLTGGSDNTSIAKNSNKMKQAYAFGEKIAQKI